MVSWWGVEALLWISRMKNTTSVLFSRVKCRGCQACIFLTWLAVWLIDGCVPAVLTIALAPKGLLWGDDAGKLECCKVWLLALSPLSIIYSLSPTSFYLLWIVSQWISSYFPLLPSDFQINWEIQDVVGKDLKRSQWALLSNLQCARNMYLRQKMEMLQMVGKSPCSLFQEMRFGLHVPLGAVPQQSCRTVWKWLPW